MKFSKVAVLLALAVSSMQADAAHRNSHSRRSSVESKMTLNSVNKAAWTGSNADPSLLVKAEVLLDRHHFSPGQIDGRGGENFHKAVRAFQQSNTLNATGALDLSTWNALSASASEPVLSSYTISGEDLAGPFNQHIPRKLEKMARLPGLSYKRPSEELAEKFHMSEDLLRTLNPRTRFDRAGETIVVAAVQPMSLRGGRDHTVKAIHSHKQKSGDGEHVATVKIDKPARDVRAYDAEGNLVAFYPATIGSKERPAPSGAFKVRRVAWNPDYHYDPKFAWKGVHAKHKLTINPGPNNPVGLVWIDLSAPSYGIHGTPEPKDIGKTESHGCIRLTNWDAIDLAAMVQPGTVVKFENEDSPVTPPSDSATGSTAK